MAHPRNGWYFSKEELENTPSRHNGMDSSEELYYRQQASNFIQDMGQRLKVSLLCINTAIVYMHRFYVFHSFTTFHWQAIAAAALFLAAKVEEQPRKLEHVIKAVNSCNRTEEIVDPEKYKTWSQELAFNENILLQTLGFEVAIDHPHTHVVRCCHLVRASKDLAQTSYIIASNSLHLTTMCLQYKPTVVACFCIHFVCKWGNWEIPLSNEKKQWYTYVDESVTAELLEQLANEFLVIYEQCPSRLKEKIMAISGEVGVSLPYNNVHPPMPFEAERRSHGEIRSGSSRPPHEPGSSGQHREYRDKKERASHHGVPPQKSHPSGSKHELHHHGHVPSVDPKFSKHLRISSLGHITNTKTEQPKDIVREPSLNHSSSKSGVSGNNSKDSSTNRDPTQQVRISDKREHSQQRPDIKPVNSLSGSGSVARPIDPNRSSSRPVDPKFQVRRREEPTKSYPNKLESDIKKHLSAVVTDKNSLLQKPVNSTSHRNKYLEQSKQTLSNNQVTPVKTEHLQQYNGTSSNSSGAAIISTASSSSSSNGSVYGLPIVDDDVKSQPSGHSNQHHQSSLQNQVVTPVVPTRKPGLFSPDQTPPKKSSPTSFSKKSLDTSNPSLLQNSFTDEEQQETNKSGSRRTSNNNSSGNVLRPLIKKIDEIQGFENIMRDSSIGLNSSHNSSAESTTNSVLKEFKQPDHNLFNSNAPIINGTETDPTVISSLLKETPVVSTHLSRTTSVLPTSSGTSRSTQKVEGVEVNKKKDSSHKKNKKEKHKHKDKEKSRDDKEKKKKHKEKDRDKHKHKHSKQEPTATVTNEVPTPIKLTIPRDKIQFPNEGPSPVKPELKLKIPRDKILKMNVTSDVPSTSSSTIINSGLKIKIPRDAYTNVNNKRDREKHSTSTSEEPPAKVLKSNYNHRYGDSKNSRNSYDKVRSYNKSNQPPTQSAPSLSYMKSVNFCYPPPSIVPPSSIAPPLPIGPPPPPPPPQHPSTSNAFPPSNGLMSSSPYFNPYAAPNQVNSVPSNHYYYNYSQVPMPMGPYSYYSTEYNNMYNSNMYHQQYLMQGRDQSWNVNPPLPSSPIQTIEMDTVVDNRPPLPLEPPPPSPMSTSQAIVEQEAQTVQLEDVQTTAQLQNDSVLSSSSISYTPPLKQTRAP